MSHFVRTDWPDLSHGNENFTFNQNYPARYVKVCHSMHEGGDFSAKLLEKAYYFVKMACPAGQFSLLQTAVTVVGLLQEGL